jgi:hypothetical protein
MKDRREHHPCFPFVVMVGYQIQRKRMVSCLASDFPVSIDMLWSIVIMVTATRLNIRVHRFRCTFHALNIEEKVLALQTHSDP